MAPLVIEAYEPPVVILTLNEPARANPLSADMAERLTDALGRAAANPNIRGVVITGAGRHFSAGADLAALQTIAAGGDPEANLADSKRLERLFATVLDLPVVTIAAVHGAAIAGGCGLASACDFVVAERSARFAYTEVLIGFIPALVSTFLTRRVPGHVARKLLLDPERISGESAVAIGLADELVDDGLAVTRATEWVRTIARKASPSGIAETKRILNAVCGLGWREALSVAAEANARQRLAPECRRGVRTFLETKHTPNWNET